MGRIMFTTKITKDTKVWASNVPNFVLFVLLSMIVFAACANFPEDSPQRREGRGVKSL